MTQIAAPPSVRDAYVARTPRSRALFERALGSIPGGSTRTTVYSPPYPPYMARGADAWTWDVDGNRYLDLLGNYTSLILGHAHPDVVRAVAAQAERGSAFAAPTETEVELAEAIRRRVRSVEALRFTNSGTEATMFAVRAARAFTGRDLVATFERGYHGTHDLVVAPPTGVPRAVQALRVELPWGDEDAVGRALAGRESDVAAILVEPVQGAGGVRAASPDFLRFLRDYTSARGILLVFDEVISFRLGFGGRQGQVGVEPDLTSFGKIVGGGYPLAAFGGRRDVMEQFDARRPDALSHGGTFNGNPVAAAAGLATLAHLTGERLDALNATGDRLVSQLREALATAGIGAQATGVGSLFQLDPPPGVSAADLFLGLLVEGYHLAPRGMGALSTAVMSDDLDGFVDAVVRVLGELSEARD